MEEEKTKPKRRYCVENPNNIRDVENLLKQIVLEKLVFSTQKTWQNVN